MAICPASDRCSALNSPAQRHLLKNSEAHQHRALEFGQHKCADFFELVQLQKLGDPGFVLILLAHRNQIHVGALGAFLCDGVLAGLQARLHGEIGVDGLWL